jgi:UDPglucose 6-dehydrogenase
MKVSVIGLGHVGLVTAGALARWGHDVIGYDVDAGKLEKLREGGVPFYEPDLAALIDEGVGVGRLATPRTCPRPSTVPRWPSCAWVRRRCRAAVPDLSYVEAVGSAVAQHASGDLVLVEKSTVPANTGLRLAQVIQRERSTATATRRHRRRLEPGVPQGGHRGPGHPAPRPDRVRHLERTGPSHPARGLPPGRRAGRLPRSSRPTSPRPS